MNYWKKKRKMEYDWKMTRSFQKKKDVLSSELFLMHFDPRAVVILASDVNNIGISAVFLQKDKLWGKKAVVLVSW